MANLRQRSEGKDRRQGQIAVHAVAPSAHRPRSRPGNGGAVSADRRGACAQAADGRDGMKIETPLYCLTLDGDWTEQAPSRGAQKTFTSRQHASTLSVL